jgi:transposase
MASHQLRQVPANLTVGLDLGDTTSRIYAIDAHGARVAEATIPTTVPGIRRYFGHGQRWCIVLEVGTHSPWVSRELAALGHDVVVANPSAVYGKRRRRKRNDRLDAEFLARQGRADRKLLYPIQHRSETAQQHLEVVRARDQLVQTRTKLVNHVRGAVKAMGSRLSRCSADTFANRAAVELPDTLRPALLPLLEVITELTRRIAAFERHINALISTHYPVAHHLQQPAGVGALTALTYVLVVEDPARFRKSRDVGPYVGLVPRLDESSESQPQLRITKAGDALCRRLLVSAAHYIMGPFGPPCDLRRHGEAIARRGGKNAKKRAVVAVARKLAVLLHQLWVSGAVYEPHYLLTRHAA